MLWYRIGLHFLLAIKSHIQLAQSSGQAGTLKHLIYVLLELFLGLIAQTYLQLPLRQWGAGNVYLLVLSTWKENIAENLIAILGL